MIMTKVQKEVVFATLPKKVFMLGRKDIRLSTIIIKDNCLDDSKDIVIKKAKKVRRISYNMYLIEDDEHIYYVLASNNNIMLDTFIAASDVLPTVGERYAVKRFIYNYGSCYEQDIKTTHVKKVKKISDTFYKVKTNHTYYVLVNNEVHE